MKIYLVNPKYPVTILGFEYVCRMTGKHYLQPSLSLLTVAALTPPMFDIALCDENAGSIQWDTDAEVVALTGMHLQRPRLIEVARRFRALGKQVVIGGDVGKVDNREKVLCSRHKGEDSRHVT